MPKYSFECQGCMTRFDRILKMGEYPTHICPACGEEAPRLFDGVGFGFGFTTSKSSAPANTGVHDLDYPTADKVVGRSAESRWAEYKTREEIKKKTRVAGGSPALTRIEDQGSIKYEAMSLEKRKAREKLVDYAVEVKKRSSDSKVP